MVSIMTNKIIYNTEIKFELVRAMLHHVPFDGWTWVAMENGAIDIGFEKTQTENKRINI